MYNSKLDPVCLSVITHFHFDHDIQGKKSCRVVFLPDVHAMEHADEKTNSGNELGIQLQESSHTFHKLREFE